MIYYETIGWNLIEFKNFIKKNCNINDKDISLEGVFTNNYVKKDSTTILFRAESKNTFFEKNCDYYIGNYISDEKHFTLPLFWAQCVLYKKDIYNDRMLNIFEDDLKYINRGFCSFVAGNNSPILRNKFTQKIIEEYNEVACGGKVFHNIDMPNNDKLKFISNYKFNICFENSKDTEYVTEKIIDAFLSKTIPVYYGDESVFKYFNKDAFIYVKNESDFDNAIERIKYLNTNDDEYIKMLKQPIFKEGFNINDMTSDFINFINNIYNN